MSSEIRSVGALLLAAGSSSRLGQPKQLLRWQGQTLLRNAARGALESGVSPVVVVLGSRPDLMAPELAGLPVQIVTNGDWETGMGSSLTFGLQALEARASKPPDAVLVLLCDQPLVTAAHLQTILDRYADSKKHVVASEYSEGVTGPPCLFSRAFFPKLRTLSPAQGARALLGRLSPEECARVPFPGGLMDVDTPNDWERVRGAHPEPDRAL